MERTKITLEDIADQAMRDKGFLPAFPPDVAQQLKAIAPPIPLPSNVRDMRQQTWISIDNDDSKDLDQLTYAEEDENGRWRIFVAVADVNIVVNKDSPIDRYAGHNTTSVYTPTRIYPMLPTELSTDLTSLNEHEDRSSVVIESEVFPDGRFELKDIYPAIVRNHAKLAYNNVSAWLEGRAPLAENGAQTPGVDLQLKQQDQIATRIKEYREKRGALSFKTVELKPVIDDGVPVKLDEVELNRGRILIENFMIAANVAMTTYMTAHKLPVVRRIVRTPKRWDRIVSLAAEYQYALPAEPDAIALQAFLVARREAAPDRFQDLSLAIIKLIGRGEYVVALPGESSYGHFDLALTLYSHATAPNRRYPDLVMQRMLKSHFAGAPLPYSGSALGEIAARCTQKEDDATKVERRVMKSAAAMVMERQIGRTFDAMVTGVNANGTWVRLQKPPVEGKLVQGDRSIDVGNRLQVKLVHVDVLNGYIDFVRVE